MSETCFLVIGMHRSGTSLLASLLEGLGIDLGDDLYPADRHNPAGYFEDRTCMEIQERMLLELRCPWHSVAGTRALPPLWWRAASMRPLVAELAAWLDRRLLTNTSRWAVKDPRTTRFIPLWRDLLAARGLRPAFLLAVRDPAEVVASELARDGVPPEQVFRIWLRHNLDALLDADDDLAGIFLYHRWFDDGTRQVRRLAQAAGLDPDAAPISAILAARLSADLYRQRSPGLVAPDWARHVFHGLEHLADHPTRHARRRFATDMEYIDAMLRGRERPRIAGGLEAIVAPPEDTDEAWKLAAASLKSGHRPTVLFAHDSVPAIGAQPAGTASAALDPAAIPLEGSPRVVRTYRVRQWLSRRAFDTVRIISGDGLAAHCLDARRHGMDDSNGTIAAHYARPPAWLDDDGNLRLGGVADLDGVCLEARILADPHLTTSGNAPLLATLRAVLPPAAPPARPADAPSRPAASAAVPLVSVCVIHHERPDFLNDCLESIRRLRYPSVECILVDDGSARPASLAFLDALEPEFSRRSWRLIRQENRYLGAARNTAARAARGTYLFFLDDDNMMMPAGLDHAVTVAEQTQADIVTAVMAKTSCPPGTPPTAPDALWIFPGAVPLLGIFENSFGDANALIRREAWAQLGGFTEMRGVGHEDWEFFAKAVLAGYRLEHSLVPFCWYRLHDNAMTRTGNWWRDYLRGLQPYRDAGPPALRELPVLAGALQRRVATLEASLAETRGALSDSLARAGHLADRLDAIEQSLDVACAEKTALRVELDSLYASRSWRVTAPLRAAKLTLAAPRHRNTPVSHRDPLPPHAPDGTDPAHPIPPSRPDRTEDDTLQLCDFSSSPIPPLRTARLHPDLGPTPTTIDASVSVVIPTRNAGPEFAFLLRKLRAQKGVGRIDVIVVDSGSTDQTVPLACRLGARVLEIRPAEFSHSHARNLGARTAGSDYLLFMVQDAQPIGSYWLHGMLRYLLDHADQNLAAVSCAEFSRTDSDVMYDHLAEAHYRYLDCLDHDRLGRLVTPDHDALRRNGQLSDVTCLIPTDTFRSLEYRGDYAEDLDLGIRLIRSGHAVAMMGSIKTVHSHNRPAVYYLKRSFVDVAFLKENFADFPIPQTMPLPGLVAGILASGALLSERLGLWTRRMLNRPAADAMSDLLREVGEYDPRAYISADIVFSDRALTDFLDDLDEAMSVDDMTFADDGNARAAHRFHDLLRGRLQHFADFAGRVFGPVDRQVAVELRAAILKTYAASVGSAIGFACQETADLPARHALVLDRLAASLRAGI